ncbi:MAG TPA: lipocalin family protein [Bryobacteraceae bacterium]|jgi:apolipoprotein D and lipocalin family protein|nr:lipocalin family protein [Bryobacteraceae bacterium]
MRRIAISLCVISAFAGCLPAADPPLRTAAGMELPKYMGQWYEVARLANRFQKSCVSATLIKYSLRPDGKFDLYNECKDSKGKLVTSTAVGRKADPQGPDSRMKVTFLRPFSADYWVIDLDQDYKWAMTGQPSRDYLWILSREPKIDESLYERLVEAAKSLGFDTSKLIRTIN